MKNRTLILGAAGFIGTNLALRLFKEGENLILFDRKDSVYTEKLTEGIKKGQIMSFEGSFTEIKHKWQKVFPQLSEVDTVYHLISTTCPTNSNRNVAVEMEDNLISTIHFLDACRETGVKKVVFLSSGGTVYGREHTGLCKEEEEAFPITVYGVQKLSIEKMLYLYNEMYHLDYRIIRLANPYGPYQKPNGVQGVVTTFTYRALKQIPIEVYGDGQVIRDYIYIDDAIEGILRIAHSNSKYRLYNLGSGIGHSIRDVLQILKEEIKGELQVEYKAGRAVDVPVNVLDISRYESQFGEFKPIPLKQGIQKLIAFYHEQEEK